MCGLQEVFKSDFYEAATFSRVLGKCFVMPVKDYYKMKPEVSSIMKSSKTISGEQKKKNKKKPLWFQNVWINCLLFQGFDDKNVFVCESRYNSKHKAFKKMKVNFTE